MAIASGRLRHRVEVRRSTATRNAYGEQVTTYSLLARPWAAISLLSANERIAVAAMQPEITHRVQIRPLDGLRATDRIVLGTRTLEIMVPPVYAPDERPVRMDLLCKEIENAPTADS